jgi:phosphomannomutase/phosphoglucomutase
LGVITPAGEIIWPDRQLLLFAKDLLDVQPGAEIIYDVKCTRLLPEAIKAAGGRPLMWKTGHSFIKAKLKETGAALAGEMSGHLFLMSAGTALMTGSMRALGCVNLFHVTPRTPNLCSILFLTVSIPRNSGWRWMKASTTH